MKSDINKFLKNLEEDLIEVKQKTAKKALKEVVDESPVWSGPYVKSHQIGIGKIDLNYEPYITAMPGNLPPKMPTALATVLKQTVYAKKSMRITTAKFKNDIFVSNSIPYADQVEYIGSHFVYKKAIRRLKNELRGSK